MTSDAVIDKPPALTLNSGCRSWSRSQLIQTPILHYQALPGDRHSLNMYTFLPVYGLMKYLDMAACAPPAAAAVCRPPLVGAGAAAAVGPRWSWTMSVVLQMFDAMYLNTWSWMPLPHMVAFTFKPAARQGERAMGCRVRGYQQVLQA